MAVDTRRSVTELLGDIAGNLQRLVRSEFRLAKAELRQEITAGKRAVMLLAAGALLGILGVGYLLLSLVLVLALVMPGWLAALIVALLTLAGAALAVAAGMRQWTAITVAPRTIASLQENMAWMNSSDN